MTADRARRRHDALVLGVALAIAVAAAQFIQGSLMSFQSGAPPSLVLVLLVGAAGLACGATIGFVVPHAFRTNIMDPFDLEASRGLSDLLRRAENTFGSAEEAQRWLFEPHRQLHGITPAEAIQFQSYASTVRGLLDKAARHGQETATDPNARPLPHVIEGGRKIG